MVLVGFSALFNKKSAETKNKIYYGGIIMKIKKIGATIVVCMLLLALAVGCGNGGDADTGATGNGATTNDGATNDVGATGDAGAATGDEIVLRAVHPGNSEAFFDLYAQIIRDFEAENPGVRVQFESFPEGYDEALVTLFAAGDAPDIIRTHAQDLGTRVAMGMLQPITPFFNNEDFSDLIDSAVVRFDGDVYFVDPYFALMVLYYNRDIFDEAGLAHPTSDWTWDDLQRNAELLDVEEDGMLVQFGYLSDWYNRFWMMHYWSHGGTFFDDESNPTTTAFDNQLALNAIQLISDMTDTVGIGADAGAGVSATEHFSNGRVAMTIDGSWMINVFDEMEDLNFGVALVPLGPLGRGGMSVSAGETMSATTNHPEEAWRYIMATFSLESSLMFSGFGDQATANGLPVWNSAYTDPRWNPNENMEMAGRQAQETINTVPTFQFSARWMWDIVNPTFQEMLADDLSAQETLDLLIQRTQRDVLDDIHR